MNNTPSDLDEAEIKSRRTIEIVKQGLNRRRAAEKRFRFYGKLAISMGMLFLVVLFTSIVSKGYTAFMQTYVKLDVYIDEQKIDPQGSRETETLSRANYGGLVKSTLRGMFPDVESRRDKKALYSIVSNGAAFEIRSHVMKNPDLIGQTLSLWVPADDDVDMLLKGNIERDVPESERRLNDNQLRWIDQLIEQGLMKTRFNTTFFTAGDSRDPELAGIWGAVSGSFLTLIVTLLLSFPVGVAAAPPVT